ncbi:MAG: hypothetical protein IPL90_00170 [Holophagales bacterium]|nr:hypothetical protein [Holophagales bacterium]
MFRSRTVFWLLAAGLFAAGAAEGLEPGKRLSQYGLDVWQQEQGLPQNTVQTVLRGRDGYLWLGTQEGLVRFDGARFTTYDRRSTPELKHNSIISLAEAPDGTLWAGTNGGGILCRHRDGTFSTIGSAEGLGSLIVWSIAFDAAGDAWVGGDGNAVQRLTGGCVVQRIGTREGLPIEQVRVLAFDPSGALWVGTTGKGVAVVRGGRVERVFGEEVLGSGLVRGLAPEAGGGVWVATSGGGLTLVKDGATTPYREKTGFPSDQVTSLHVDAAGTVWFGTWGAGVGRLKDGVAEVIGTREGLSNDQIWAVTTDEEGSLWIGTWVGGLNRLRDGKFLTYTVREGLTNDNVRAVCEARDGSVWIGTAGGGLNRLKDGRITSYREADGLPSDHVSALLEDSNGTLWVGTNLGGAARFSGGRFTPLGTAQGLPHHDVRAFLEDRHGNIWIAAIGGGLTRVAPDGTLRVFTVADGLPTERFIAIAESPDGAIWLASSGGGLTRLADDIRVFTTKQGLSSDRVIALLADADGTVWAGTSGGGLNRIRDGKIASVTTREGLYDDLVQVILDDGKGSLWMTCNKGVFRVARAELDAVADGRAADLRSVAFGTSDGMRSASAAGGQQPAGFVASDGRLWFPTYRGVAVLDPSRIRTSGRRPRVAIEDVFVDGRPADLRGPLVLPPGTERVEFHYTALTLVAPDRVRFRIRLDGLENEPVDVGTRRVAYYTNLPSGSYVFRVSAADASGEWSERVTSLSFQKAPRARESWWFWASLAVLATAAAWAVLRWRVAQHHAREAELLVLVEQRTRSLSEEKSRAEEALAKAEAARVDAERHREVAERATAEAEEASRTKSRFLANVSHELRTPLNAIIGYSEMLSEEASEEGRPALVRDLERVRTAAIHQLELISSVLDLAKIEAGKLELDLETFPLGPLVEETTEIVQPLLARNRNRLVVRGAAEEGVTMTSDPRKVRQCLFNLLSNACRFTQDGTVELEVRRFEDEGRAWVSFRVSDTGIGISGDELGSIFEPFAQADLATARRFGGTGLGLSITRQLCELMGGRVTVESTPGTGSTFEIRLPADVSA